jgi:hypothetical protein
MRRAARSCLPGVNLNKLFNLFKKMRVCFVALNCQKAVRGMFMLMKGFSQSLQRGGGGVPRIPALVGVLESYVRISQSI